MKQMREDSLNSRLEQNPYSARNNCGEVDPVNYLIGIKKMKMEVVVQAAVKIQRFWRRISMKNIFWEYGYIFQSIINNNDIKMNLRSCDDSGSDQILVCSGESIEELTLEKS
jgi:hypothetical protein